MGKDYNNSSIRDEKRIPADSIHEIKSDEDEIDLLELIGIIWVHKWWIAGITGLAAVVVILYTIFSTTVVADREDIKTYTSTAVVLVNEAFGIGIPFSMYEGRFDISSLLNSTSLLISYGLLAEELLNNTSMHNELVEIYNLSSEGFGRGSLEAKYEKQSGLLRISYTLNDQEKAQEVVEGAFKLIQVKFELLITNYASEEKEILEKKLGKTMEEFLTLKYKIREFQNEHSLIGASEETEVKNLLKKDFELYMNMEIERDIKQNLIDYLPRLILFASLKDEIESPLFQLIDEPMLTDSVEDSGMSAKVLISVVITAAFFLSIFLVFIMNAVNNIRSNPERMKKLKGIK